jgi:hypothetical protein
VRQPHIGAAKLFVRERLLQYRRASVVWLGHFVVAGDARERDILDRRDYRTGNGCAPHDTVQDGVCKPYRGY